MATRQQLRENRRRLAMGQIQMGMSHKEVAAMFGASDRSVRRWMLACSRGGLEAIAARPIRGRPSKLSEGGKTQLEVMLRSSPRVFGLAADKWSQSLVAKLIRDKFGISYHRDHIPRLLRAIAPKPQPAPVPQPQPYGYDQMPALPQPPPDRMVPPGPLPPDLYCDPYLR